MNEWYGMVMSHWWCMGGGMAGGQDGTGREARTFHSRILDANAMAW